MRNKRAFACCATVCKGKVWLAGVLCAIVKCQGEAMQTPNFLCFKEGKDVEGISIYEATNLRKTVKYNIRNSRKSSRRYFMLRG